MGCSPSKVQNGIIEIRRERADYNRVTSPSVSDAFFPKNNFQQINVSLFIIGEENSKYEESCIPSNFGTMLTPQPTEKQNDI